MSEFDNFMATLEGKSENTKKAYRIQYNKFYKLLDKNIGDASQQKIMDTIDEVDNNNAKQALLNIGILIRKKNESEVNHLEKLRDKLKGSIKEAQKVNNRNLDETLPSYEELIEYIESLKDKKFYRDYIINYLLINYNVRNEDLLFKIVTRKKETKQDATMNYIWLSPRKAEYIRNDYKTAKTYGKKVNIITDKPFLSALRQIIKNGNIDFIPNPNQVGYYIKQATLLGVGEGNYNKIVVNHFRNDIDKLKEISNNRGTSITTLLESYDIKDQ